MLKAVSNTSPFLSLYRFGGLEWLPKLFDEVWIPEAVKIDGKTDSSQKGPRVEGSPLPRRMG
mgnify:CR=1 FL=1